MPELTFQHAKISLTWTKLKFESHIIYMLLCVFFLVATAALCSWQVSRGIEKAHQLSNLEVIPLVLNQSSLDTVSPDQFPQPAAITAQLDTSHAMLLDNRFLDHKLGYEILMPALVEGLDESILIKLGFIPRDISDWQTVIDTLPTHQITIAGSLVTPQLNRYVKQWTNEPYITWPLIIQQIDLNSISAALNLTLTPYVFHADTNPIIKLPTVELSSYMTPSRHYGYALQWGLLSLIIFIGFSCATLNKRDTT